MCTVTVRCGFDCRHDVLIAGVERVSDAAAPSEITPRFDHINPYDIRANVPKELGRQVAFNARLDAALAALFALVTGWVVLAAAREWWLVLQGRKPAVAQETPFVESAYAS